MNEYLKVEGSEGLERDPVTGAIINRNINEKQKYLERKRKLQLEREELNSLKNDVQDLKNIVDILLKKLEEK